MKLNNVKRIITEDFPSEDQETISKLGYIINVVFEQLVQGFNKNFTIADNLNETISNINVVVDSNGVPLTPTTVKYALLGKCQGVQVINAVNNTDTSVYPASAPYVVFIQSNNVLQIKKIYGLQTNNKYTLTLRITGI